MSTVIFRFRPHFNRFNRLSACVRDKSAWTSEKILTSTLKEVDIPNLTVDQYMFMNLDKWATKTAVICGHTNRQYTYEEVYKKSRIFAANLRRKFKIKDGDTVAILMPNAPEYPIITFGVLAAGGVVTTMNPVYTAYEIQRQILLSETTLIITNEDLVPTVKEALKLAEKDFPIISLNIKSNPEGTASFKELVEDDHLDTSILKEVNRQYDDVAFLPYSSGTTGLPKGVQLTNRNIIANCEQQNTDYRQYEYTTESHQDCSLVVLPMFHCYALSICMLHKMSVGLKLVTLPKFQPDMFLNSLLAHRFDLLYLAPPLVMFVGSYPQMTAKHLEKVRAVTSGAAPLPSADIQRLFEKAEREIQFCQGYGLTETSPLISLTPFGQKTYEDVGYLLPNMACRIVDEKMNNLGPGQVGELVVKGPNVMKGYLKNPKANSEVFVEGDWFRTGDLAKINEDGLITIADRLKELIKVKGYQVPPAELENVLKEHPAVLDAAVVGVPDQATGERPRGFVVLKPEAKANDKDIKEFVSKRVAPYKKINEITFLKEIPKNPSGKILRKTLKEQYCK
uniref:Luciferin 4-monooxygenase n=1 Tax=Spodoptera frugiperda TaxID=7108 RepID=A0A2H1V6K9_SPOFR